jgi:hypothetical protein
MKVKVIESKQEIPFPKLMESDIGTIVLFYKEREGVLLKTVPESFKEVGEYHEEWAMDCFTDFEGKLELTNK